MSSKCNKILPSVLAASDHWQSFKFGQEIKCQSLRVNYKILSLHGEPACLYIGFITKSFESAGFDYHESLADGRNQTNSIGIYINHASICMLKNGKHEYVFKKLKSSGFHSAKCRDVFTLKYDFNKSKCKLFYNGKRIKGKIDLDAEVVIPALSLYYPHQEIQITTST